jgi:hypothetical protein
VHSGLLVFDVLENVYPGLAFRAAALNQEKNNGQRRKPDTLISQASTNSPFSMSGDEKN